MLVRIESSSRRASSFVEDVLVQSLAECSERGNAMALSRSVCQRLVIEKFLQGTKSSESLLLPLCRVHGEIGEQLTCPQQHTRRFRMEPLISALESRGSSILL